MIQVIEIRKMISIKDMFRVSMFNGNRKKGD